VGVFVKLLRLGQPILVVLEETGYELLDHEEKSGGQKRAVREAAKRGVKEGDVYKWGVCGVEGTGDEVCGSIDDCDILCCEKPMKPKTGLSHSYIILESLEGRGSYEVPPLQ